MFTRAHHLSLSWARAIQSMPSPHPTSWKSILTHWGRVTQICVYIHINNLNTPSPMC
jgi:hypothetical protein